MKPFHILLVEDDPDHAGLISELLVEDAPELEITHRENGNDGLSYLEQCFRDKALPDLILLDLNMPGLNGVEVMQCVKADPRFVRIPAVLLTTSAAPGDIDAALSAHANSYICKSTDLDDFEGVLNSLRHYWRNVHLATCRGGCCNEA
ncbi:MAG: response regulator [Pseudomonadota bacterium]